MQETRERQQNNAALDHLCHPSVCMLVWPPQHQLRSSTRAAVRSVSHLPQPRSLIMGWRAAHLEYMKKRLIIQVMSVRTWTSRLGMACRMLLIMFRPLMVPSVMP